MRPDDPLGIRSDFPVVEQAIYLASAAITPTPNPVTQAGVDFVRAKGGVPIGLDAMFDKCDELRARFAALIQVTTPEVGIIYTTSEAENLIVRALNLQPGDNIVTDDLHYSASYVIYDQLVKRGIDVRIAPRRADGSAPPAIFAPLMDSRTRLLSVAWISHQNG